jgi:hypothetical protein
MYTRTFVSKNALPFIGLFAAEREAGRQGPTQPAQAGEGFVLAPVAGHFELASTSDADLDLIACLQAQRLYDRRGKPHR